MKAAQLEIGVWRQEPGARSQKEGVIRSVFTNMRCSLWDSPYIKPDQLTKGHVDATLSRIKNHQIIWAIQETTELNYTTHKTIKGVGYLDSKYAQGLKLHSNLAATTQGLPLGIIDQYSGFQVYEVQ